MISQAAVSSPSANPDAIRQLVLFPPDGVAQRAGLVRERFMLLELKRGTVYHLRFPCDWDPVEQVGNLAEMLGGEGVCPGQKQTASGIGWTLGTTLNFVDLDLAEPVAAVWPVRAVALQRCCFNSPPDQSTHDLAHRVTQMEAAISNAVSTSLRNFVSHLNLNQEILSLSYLWGGTMPWTRFNYFASAQDETVRAYRKQAAAVMPALVTSFSSEVSIPTSFSRTLSDVIDAGRPLVDALASTARIRTATARHSLSMPAELAESGGLRTLLQALNSLIPERFPRTVEDWATFAMLVYQVIPKLTDRSPACPINFALLTTISRSGWQQAQQQLSHLCRDDAAAASLREFLAAYRQALVWDIQDAITSRIAAQNVCTEVVDEVLAKVGALRLLEAARSFPSLLGEVKSELTLTHRDELLRGERWNGVIEEPMVFDGCAIDPALTLAQISRLATDLKNCLGSYAYACADGKAHIFSVRTVAGEQLGAAGFRFHLGRYGGYIIECFDCKGPHNAPISEEGHRAVMAFGEWLKTGEGQRRITLFRNTRVSRYRGTKREIAERIAMECNIAALRKLRHKSLRFDALREKVMRAFAAV